MLRTDKAFRRENAEESAIAASGEEAVTLEGVQWMRPKPQSTVTLVSATATSEIIHDELAERYGKGTSAKNPAAGRCGRKSLR